MCSGIQRQRVIGLSRGAVCLSIIALCVIRHGLSVFSDKVGKRIHPRRAGQHGRYLFGCSVQFSEQLRDQLANPVHVAGFGMDRNQPSSKAVLIDAKVPSCIRSFDFLRPLQGLTQSEVRV